MVKSITGFFGIIAAILFYICLIVGIPILLILLINIIRINNAPIVPTEFFWYLWHYTTSTKLLPRDAENIGVISQPIILLLTVLALLYPLYTLIRDRIKNFTSIIKTYKTGFSKNRKKSAMLLAEEFKGADYVCIVSGDFSWFHQDGDAGRQALDALLVCARQGCDHSDIYSYKSRADVESGLSKLDQALAKEFIEHVKYKPALKA